VAPRAHDVARLLLGSSSDDSSSLLIAMLNDPRS